MLVTIFVFILRRHSWASTFFDRHFGFFVDEGGFQPVDCYPIVMAVNGEAVRLGRSF